QGGAPPHPGPGGADPPLRGTGGHDAVVEADDATLIELARSELERRFGIASEPDLARIFRWPRGMPQYHRGHGARLARIARVLSSLPGLTLAGSAYRRVGIPDCIRQGWAAADRILDRPTVVAA
ncbi:MAG TPA: FAD-dependent oxidoreductase, partial [Gemmatimonadales bacterium]|nr:FAD-dependent oxidoreductase [Gemmatimonadales bacterium]